METTATFRLFGREEGLTAGAVTERLGIQPSEAFEAGTPIGKRSTSLRKASGWLLRTSPSIEEGVELPEQLERLLDILAPLQPALWQLVELGYDANWFCYLASNPAEHAAELDRELLTRLLDLPGDLWIDACGDCPSFTAPPET